MDIVIQDISIKNPLYLNHSQLRESIHIESSSIINTTADQVEEEPSLTLQPRQSMATPNPKSAENTQATALFSRADRPQPRSDLSSESRDGSVGCDQSFEARRYRPLPRRNNGDAGLGSEAARGIWADRGDGGMHSSRCAKERPGVVLAVGRKYSKRQDEFGNRELVRPTHFYKISDFLPKKKGGNNEGFISQRNSSLNKSFEPQNHSQDESKEEEMQEEENSPHLAPFRESRLKIKFGHHLSTSMPEDELLRLEDTYTKSHHRANMRQIGLSGLPLQASHPSWQILDVSTKHLPLPCKIPPGAKMHPSNFNDFYEGKGKPYWRVPPRQGLFIYEQYHRQRMIEIVAAKENFARARKNKNLLEQSKIKMLNALMKINRQNRIKNIWNRVFEVLQSKLMKKQFKKFIKGMRRRIEYLKPLRQHKTLPMTIIIEHTTYHHNKTPSIRSRGSSTSSPNRNPKLLLPSGFKTTALASSAFQFDSPMRSMLKFLPNSSDNDFRSSERKFKRADKGSVLKEGDPCSPAITRLLVNRSYLSHWMDCINRLLKQSDLFPQWKESSKKPKRAGYTETIRDFEFISLDDKTARELTSSLPFRGNLYEEYSFIESIDTEGVEIVFNMSRWVEKSLANECLRVHCKGIETRDWEIEEMKEMGELGE